MKESIKNLWESKILVKDEDITLLEFWNQRKGALAIMDRLLIAPKTINGVRHFRLIIEYCYAWIENAGHPENQEKTITGERDALNKLNEEALIDMSDLLSQEQDVTPEEILSIRKKYRAWFKLNQISWKRREKIYPLDIIGYKMIQLVEYFLIRDEKEREITSEEVTKVINHSFRYINYLIINLTKNHFKHHHQLRKQMRNELKVILDEI